VVTELVLAILASSLLTAVVTQLFQRRKNQADTTHVFIEATNLLIAPMNARIAELQAEVLVLRADTHKCHLDREADRKRIEILEMELRRNKLNIPEIPFTV
jgi:hypothetical protein